MSYLQLFQERHSQQILQERNLNCSLGLSSSFMERQTPDQRTANVDFEGTEELLQYLNHKRNGNEKQQSKCEMQQSIDLELTISSPSCSYGLFRNWGTKSVDCHVNKMTYREELYADIHNVIDRYNKHCIPYILYNSSDHTGSDDH